MNYILLMASAAGANQSPLPNVIMIVAIIGVFYFFMIRPQTKKAKDQKNFIEKLQKGDRIITQSGIHGKIVETDPAYILVEVDHNVRIKFDRSAISMELSEPLNKTKTAVLETK
jgi:preprotein translocase subunit YajC